MATFEVEFSSDADFEVEFSSEADFEAEFSDGVMSYNELIDLPEIEGVTLTGNKTYEQLNLQGISNMELEALLNS